jgi:hypothetical protein
VRHSPCQDNLAHASSTVVAFRLALTDRHRESLARWVKAGQRMGLHDAQICADPDQPAGRGQQAVIWVRENADPAYAVIPRHGAWQVKDCIRSRALGEFRSFEEALDFIRPVGDLTQAA